MNHVIRSSNNFKKIIQAVTLAELIIAMVLVAFVVLAVGGIQYFSYSQAVINQRRVQLQNELSYVLEHLDKHTKNAIGTQTDPAINSTTCQNGTCLRIRIDTNKNARVDATDTWIVYWRQQSNISYYPHGGRDACPPQGESEPLANHIEDTQDGFNVSLVNNIILEVRLKARWYPQRPPAQDNPSLELKNKIKLAGQPAQE